jgi:hypothetical protein
MVAHLPYTISLSLYEIVNRVAFGILYHPTTGMWRLAFTRPRVLFPQGILLYNAQYSLQDKRWCIMEKQREALQEALEIMRNEELMAAFRKGVEALEKGETVAWEDVKRELGLQGRGRARRGGGSGSGFRHSQGQRQT